MREGRKGKVQAPLYYRNACGALGVLDVTKAGSLEGLAAFVGDLRERVVGLRPVLVVLANKVDKGRERVVDREAVAAFAESVAAEAWVETSALTGEGVDRAFKALAKAILAQDWTPPPPSPEHPLPDSTEPLTPGAAKPKKCAC